MTMLSDAWHMFRGVLQSLDELRVVLWIFIVFYYVVSFAFIVAERRGVARGMLARNGLLDWFTSAFWVCFAVVLIWSLASHAATNSLTLGPLAEFYIFFLFLFAFLYGLVEWHSPGKLDGVSAREYEAELQYFFISLGAQTTCGYTRAKPNHWITESIAAIQTLLGVGFLAVWVSAAVNRASN